MRKADEILPVQSPSNLLNAVQLNELRSLAVLAQASSARVGVIVVGVLVRTSGEGLESIVCPNLRRPCRSLDCRRCHQKALSSSSNPLTQPRATEAGCILHPSQSPFPPPSLCTWAAYATCSAQEGHRMWPLRRKEQARLKARASSRRGQRTRRVINWLSFVLHSYTALI